MDDFASSTSTPVGVFGIILQCYRQKSNGNSIQTMWLRIFEAWLISRLLRSPSFQRSVRTIHKKVHELRHGKDPAEMGGTNIDVPGKLDSNRFLKYYMEELKDQFRGLKK